MAETVFRVRGDGVEQLKRGLDDAAGSARRLDRTKVGIDTRGASRQLTDLGKRLDDMGKRAQSSGRSMTYGMTLPIAAGFTSAVKSALDFQSSLKQIEGLVGINAKQVKAWGDQILKLAPTVGKSPKELADALYFVTSSGLDTSKAIDVLTVSAKAAAAGLGETEVVADALTSAINAYGANNLDAAKAGDILTAAIREGKAEASAFAPVLGNVLPLAAQMGVQFDEVAAAAAAMTTKGTDAATAVTNISALLSGLLHPAKQSEDAFKAVGTSGADLRKELAEKGLLATLQDLRSRFQGNDEALGKALPNIRALRGLLSLTGKDADATSGVFNRLAHTNDDLGKSFDKVATGPQFKLDQQMARLKASAIEAGTTLIPFAIKGAEAIADLATAFANLDPKAQKAALALAAAAAAAGPLTWLAGGAARGVGALARGAGALGRLARGGAAATAASTVAGGVGGVQKVWVVNMGPGGLGGAPGPSGPLGRVGSAAGRAGAAVPGIGTLATGGIAAPLAGGAALIGAGIGLNKLDDKYHFMTSDPAESRRSVMRAQNAMIDQWRKGGPGVNDAIRKALGPGAITATKDTIETFKTSASKAINLYSQTIVAGGGTIRKASERGIRDQAVFALKDLPPTARKLAADSMIRMTAALENGGKAPKGATQRLVKAITAAFGDIPTASAAAAKGASARLGEIRSALQGLSAAAGDVATAIAGVSANIAAMPVPKFNPADVAALRGGFSGGGITRGPYRGVDDRLVPLAGNEAVLTPSQVMLADSGLSVREALRVTGGDLSGVGRGFARGGVVDDVWSRIQSKMGSRYVYGAWDCSKFATWAVNPGATGSTAWAYANSRPASGSEPIVWGLRNNGSGNVYDGGKDEHMGIGVLHGGRRVWFDNGGHAGGSYVGSDSDSARWEVVRVPNSVAGLTDVGGGDDTKANTKGQGTPLQRLTRALLGVGFDPKGGSKAGSPDSARGVAKAILKATPDYSADTPGTSLTGDQTRAQSGAGRTAMARARKAGLSPDQVAAAGAAAERDAEVKFLNRNLLLAREDMDKLSQRKGTLLGQLRKVQRSKRAKPGAKKAAARQIRVALAAISAEMGDLRDVVAEVKARLLEIGEEVTAEQYQARYDAEQERASAAAQAATDTAATVPAVDEAALAAERTARYTAERTARVGEAFIRGAFGSGDLERGGRTAIEAAGGRVAVDLSGWQVLSPTDPSVLQKIAGAVTAGLGAQGSQPAKTTFVGL